jgi:hypothetical protein
MRKISPEACVCAVFGASEGRDPRSHAGAIVRGFERIGAIQDKTGYL